LRLIGFGVGSIPRVESTPWNNTTHDWAAGVDQAHLAVIREDPWTFAPAGQIHLTLEVLAYVADEAECGSSGGRCVVTMFANGSVSIVDFGRGTDMRRDASGRILKKPVLSSKDLRFFDSPETQALPDGHPRRGMSVVSALSEWLVHVNRREDGSWCQRYEDGVPVTDLMPIAGDGTSGTTVHFMPREGLRGAPIDLSEVARCARVWRHLDVELKTSAVEPSYFGVRPSAHAAIGSLGRRIGPRGLGDSNGRTR
jgi:topoisomerase IV subunit B